MCHIRYSPRSDMYSKAPKWVHVVSDMYPKKAKRVHVFFDRPLFSSEDIYNRRACSEMIFALFGILAILSSRRSAICVRLLGVVGCLRGLLVTFDSRRGRAHVEHVVPLRRRRILARTRLSDICGALAGEERMVESCQARSKVCHEPCHRSTVRSLPRREGLCPKASWSV